MCLYTKKTHSHRETDVTDASSRAKLHVNWIQKKAQWSRNIYVKSTLIDAQAGLVRQ